MRFVEASAKDEVLTDTTDADARSRAEQRKKRIVVTGAQNILDEFNANAARRNDLPGRRGNDTAGPDEAI